MEVNILYFPSFISIFVVTSTKRMRKHSVPLAQASTSRTYLGFRRFSTFYNAI